MVTILWCSIIDGGKAKQGKEPESQIWRSEAVVFQQDKKDRDYRLEQSNREWNTKADKMDNKEHDKHRASFRG